MYDYCLYVVYLLSQNITYLIITLNVKFMKKTTVLFMMLVSFITIFTSCKDDSSENGTQEVTLAVTGNNGELITVYETDVVKDVTIKSAENVDRDIEVTLTTNAVDGNGVLSAATAILAKGTNTTTVTITFPASKFPRETAEKAIKVTATTRAGKVIFSPDFTTFNVKGQNGIETPATLTATTPNTEVIATYEPGVAIIDFSLDKPLSIDAELDCQYEAVANNINTKELRWMPYPVTIPAGQKSLQLKITAPAGTEGALKLTINSTNGLVIVQTKSMEFNFVVKREAALSTTTVGYVNVADEDVTKQIAVTLNKSVQGGAIVNLAVTSNNDLLGTLSTQTVQFAEGETSKMVNITFAAADFTKDTEAVVTVTATSENVGIKASASNVSFTVAGPSDKQDGQVWWIVYYDFTEPLLLEGNVRFPSTYEKRGYMPMTIYAEVGNPAFDDKFFFDPPITFELVLTGNLTTDDIVFEEGVVLIYPDTNFGSCNFKIMKSAIGKEGTINFVSKGTTFRYTQKPCPIKVVRE